MALGPVLAIQSHEHGLAHQPWLAHGCPALVMSVLSYNHDAIT